MISYLAQMAEDSAKRMKLSSYKVGVNACNCSSAHPSCEKLQAAIPE